MRPVTTHSTDNLVQQEVIELTEDEEGSREDVIPHWSDLIEDGQHDVRHDAKIDKNGAGDCFRVSVGKLYKGLYGVENIKQKEKKRR